MLQWKHVNTKIQRHNEIKSLNITLNLYLLHNNIIHINWITCFTKKTQWMLHSISFTDLLGIKKMWINKHNNFAICARISSLFSDMFRSYKKFNYNNMYYILVWYCTFIDRPISWFRIIETYHTHKKYIIIYQYLPFLRDEWMLWFMATSDASWMVHVAT